MKDFSIGDFVCLKNHPYFDDNLKIKIAANADMTPPIMIISEILDKDEYDNLTGEKSESQLRCYYYSTKEGKYFDKWIKINQVKKLSPIETNLNNNEFDNIEDYDLDYLKKTYKDKLVCLKNVDLELNKKKIFIDSSDGIRTNKENNHLDFLPPVMTIVDIVKNKEEKKFSSTKSKSLEKDIPKYFFKCKWYNSKTSSYSEELLPSNILGIVNNQKGFIQIINIAIEKKSYIVLKLKNPFILEENNNEIENTIIKPVELIFNHYYYKLNATDYSKQKIVSYALNDIYFNKNDIFYSTYIIDRSLIFGQTFPRYKTKFEPITDSTFVEKEYYLISYRDKLNRITQRIIKVIMKEPYTDPNNDEHIFIVANCLLRHGHIRHFNINQITQVTQINKGSNLFENILEDLL